MDVLVSFRADAHIGLIGLCEMELELSRIIGRKVDLVTKSGLKPLVREAVLSRDGAALWRERAYLADIVEACKDK